MPLTDNMIAWYNLDEPSGSPRLDSSGNGNTLTERNGTVAQVTGLLNYAAGTPGNTSTNLARNAAWFTSGAFAFTFFFYLNDAAESGHFCAQTVPLGRGAIDVGGVSINNGVITAHIVENTSPIQYNSGATANAWHHVVFQYDGSSKLQLYFDGVFVAESTGNTYGASTPTLSVILAQVSAGGNGQLNGRLDLFGIRSTVFTDGGVSVGQTAGGEIAQLYNGGAGFDPYAVNATVAVPFVASATITFAPSVFAVNGTVGAVPIRVAERKSYVPVQSEGDRSLSVKVDQRKTYVPAQSDGDRSIVVPVQDRSTVVRVNPEN